MYIKNYFQDQKEAVLYEIELMVEMGCKNRCDSNPECVSHHYDPKEKMCTILGKPLLIPTTTSPGPDSTASPGPDVKRK